MSVGPECDRDRQTAPHDYLGHPRNPYEKECPTVADDRARARRAKRNKERAYAAVRQDRYDALDKLCRNKMPEPSRITCALDACALYGPEVDQACGVEEPAVDQWESGELIPTYEQIERLAALTGYAVRFFYGDPLPDVSGAFFCENSGGPR